MSLLLPAAATATLAQGGAGQASQDEQNLAKAVMTAPDPVVQIKTAADFVKKYPKSTLRPRLAQELAQKIDGATDPVQKVNGAQAFRGIFNEPSEQEMIAPTLIDGLVQSKRTDEAFTIGAEIVAKNPDSIEVLIQLVSAGTNEAKNKNGKFVTQSLQYGTTAIQLIEADKKPAWMDVTAWAKYKSVTLPSMHQSLGLLYLVSGNRAQAKESYTKASSLAPSDPFNYLMLGAVLDQDYNDAAKRYQTMPAGPAKEAELPKVLAAMDSIIDAHAHMLALSEGTPTLQDVRKQVLEDFERYYKYRHNSSTAGMQELINKYKVTPKP